MRILRCDAQFVWKGEYKTTCKPYSWYRCSPSNNLTLTPADFVQYCEDAGYIPLNMKPEHVITASKLETSTIDKLHSDPFDRLLLAQAKTENLVFLTHDVKFSLHKERCVRMV